MSWLDDTKSIFSKNMRDIVVAVGKVPSATVEVSDTDGNAASFLLQPVNTFITLCTSEVIDSFAQPYPPRINTAETQVETIHPISLKISVDGVIHKSIYIPTIWGGVPDGVKDEHYFLQHHFLTWRPQIGYVTKGIKQQLSLAIADTQVGVSDVVRKYRSLYVKVYFRSATPIELPLEKCVYDNSIYRIDCSYQRILDLVRTKLSTNDDIVAYDVYGKADNSEYASMVPQRFIVLPYNSAYEYFFFQNTMGGFDTIIAYGSTKSISSSEVSASVVRRQETELVNDFMERWETNTGYINSNVEKGLWQEFLRSTNRYILRPDGTARRIIVDDCKAEHTRHKVGSFTFEYHYAEQDKGAYYKHQETLTEL